MMSIYEGWFLAIGMGFLFAYLFVFEPYGFIIERILPFKPFNCVLCLSFWVTLILYTAIDLNPLHAIYTALIAELTYRKLINE
jgi:hypothetical protein